MRLDATIGPYQGGECECPDGWYVRWANLPDSKRVRCLRCGKPRPEIRLTGRKDGTT